jgi:uncharacterized membrane protein HdeD (DUF308 family)
MAPTARSRSRDAGGTRERTLHRDVPAILFGIPTVVWPGVSVATLVLLFAVYALVEGATSLVLAFMHAEGRVGTWVLHAIIAVPSRRELPRFTWPRSCVIWAALGAYTRKESPYPTV